MRILIISDSWKPQSYDITHGLLEAIDGLRHIGHDVKVISLADGFTTFALPTNTAKTYALFPYKQLAGMIEAFSPDTVHIASEGSLGKAARRWCLKHQKAFTTTYQGYLVANLSGQSKQFHQQAERVIVYAKTAYKQLKSEGLTNVHLWMPGVDLEKFAPGDRSALDHLCAPDAVHLPKFVYVGRISYDKGLEAFLSLDLPGTKWIIGEGEAHRTLEAKYPDAKFLGTFHPDELIEYYRASDVFVFPSKKDIFGFEVMEAMACGTPVAAFPAVGTMDIVIDDKAGVLNDDLKKACVDALKLRRADVRQTAEHFDGEKSLKQFERLLQTKGHTGR